MEAKRSPSILLQMRPESKQRSCLSCTRLFKEKEEESKTFSLIFIVEKFAFHSRKISGEILLRINHSIIHRRIIEG
jgi:hypothetical protein